PHPKGARLERDGWLHSRWGRRRNRQKASAPRPIAAHEAREEPPTSRRHPQPRELGGTFSAAAGAAGAGSGAVAWAATSAFAAGSAAFWASSAAAEGAADGADAGFSFLILPTKDIVRRSMTGLSPSRTSVWLAPTCAPSDRWTATV